jgi:uncharacterized membrane protein YphA (DoxX/SURF4 family)
MSAPDADLSAETASDAAPAAASDSAAATATATATAAATATATASARWSPAKRVAFRFACAYFGLYSFPSPIGLLPGMGWLNDAYEALWDALVPWVGNHLLHIPGEIKSVATGSGDTTYNYVHNLCVLVLALLATLVWTAVDRRRVQYEKLDEWLRVYLRYNLALTMLGYGFAKVFHTQFPFPHGDRLLTPYGNSSPMGLLWTFMGYSTAYNVFTGGAEVLGGVLLLFRRTTTLGALVVIGVMSNVVMLNFCYDVPVKLFSSHLLVMALLLTMPDLQRLANVFVLNRPAAPVVFPRHFERKWLERARIAAKVLLVGTTVVMGVIGQMEARRMISEGTGMPIQGIYEVETFRRDGQEVPPLLTETSRWRRVFFNRFGSIIIRPVDDTSKFFRVQIDAEKKSIALTPRNPADAKVTLSYGSPDPEHLVIEGVYEGARIEARLRKREESEFLLVNRGFHWINEFPFNR